MGVAGLDRFKRDSLLMRAGLQLLKDDRSWDSALTVGLGTAMAERYESVVASAESGRPFAVNSFGMVPELFEALGLPWYSLMIIPFLPMARLDLEKDIEAAESIGLGSDLCTVVRLCVHYVYGQCIPAPAALVGTLSPCDGAGVLHQAIMRRPGWKDVPAFCLDPPYWKDERGLQFFVAELRRMLDFLAGETGARLDPERLRLTIEESNRHYRLWSEYTDMLRRAVPCPRGVTKGAQAWHVAQNFLAGDPRGSDWFRELIRLTENDIQEGLGEVPGEKIRILWFDIRPVWLGEITQWLKDEWKACIVMDMMGFAPYTPIDTSSEETMLRGLAGRCLREVPMIRQMNGVADLYARDIGRIVEDYAISCVIWPGHMGHKDAAGGLGIMKQACAETGVPFLDLGLDLVDRRYTPIDEIKDRMSRFFSARGLG